MSAQPVTVCEGEEFDLEAYIAQEFPSCAVDSIEITSSGIPSIVIGEYDVPFTVDVDGTVTVEIYEAGVLCSTENIDFDLVEANFTATAVQGSCLLVDIEPPTNSSTCTYTYTIEGNAVPGPISQYQFANGGLNSILLDAQCGSCFDSQMIQVDVDGPIAGLNVTAANIFFDTDLGTFVICTEDQTGVVTLSDASQQVSAGATYTVTVIFPDGTSENGSTFPLPYEFTVDQQGIYTVEYVIDDNGCIAETSYEIFVSNPNVSTELEVPVTVGTFTCEDSVFEVSICPNGCPTNPPGTVYEVILECTNFFFSTTTVPALVPVPLNVASCGATCESGGADIPCSCDLVVRALRPCTNPVSNTICPFQIQPLPNANFDISPPDPSNTYCEGSSLFFDPTWISEDCNGPNPALSICEIQNPEWSISPATGWTVPGNNLNVNNLSAQFNDPGEYTISFEWFNSCGSSVRTETVCIVPDEDPTVQWFQSPTYCVGETIDPTVGLPNVSCVDADITWMGPDLQISDPTSPSPIVEFTQTGTILLELEVEGLCTDFNDFASYTVCDEPQASLSQTDLELCVGQEFCFEQLYTLNWNNCVGDVTWQFDSLPGSPILNPIGSDLCFTWDSAEEFEFYVEAENTCGIAYDTISVVITDAPSCPIASPGDFCVGDEIDISAPLGADPASIQWFFSTDNGGSFNPLLPGMPDNPTVTTQYFVTSTVNDCFCISDTVEATLIPEPSFSVEVSEVNPCPEAPIFLTTQPLVGDVTWEFGTTSVLDDTLFLNAPESAEIFSATLIYGTIDTQCSVTETASVDPVVNPLSITCNLPTLICEGDDPLSTPDVSPLGGTNFITNSNGDVVETNVTEINPVDLPADSYNFVYEILESGCVFRDSCSFEITSPQTSDISPATDTLCYNQTVDFTDQNALAGNWSSSCAGAIDGFGFFDPESASCPPNSVVEIYYAGDCILNDTLEVFLVDIPTVTIVASNDFPCPGDVVTYSIDPPQSLITWTDGDANSLGTGPTVDVVIDEPTTIIADVDVGVPSVSCIVQTSISVSPETNPIDIDCSVFPPVWCTGDDPINSPDVLPGGGITTVIDEQGNVMLTNPSTIQTEDLGDGTFFFVYEITGWGPGSCTFRDSCEFIIAEPAVPVFELVPDSICYNSVFNYNEISGLTGEWSSSCLGSIDPVTGILDPEATACLQGSDLELVYSGNCIENDTLTVHLIALPEAVIEIPQDEICANECLPFGQSITGDFDFYEWTISWADQELVFVNEDPIFCPDEVGLNSAVTVSVNLSVFTATNPQCVVSDEAFIQVIRIPDETFLLDSPQCIETAIVLPDCEECDSYDLFFSNEWEEFNCSVPGDNCAPPDTGIYQYELVYDFGACLSDTVEGEVQIIDIPFLSILEVEYDTCAPVVDYSLFYGGFDFEVIWETTGDIILTNPLGGDEFLTVIDQSEEVEVDTLYTDIITVQNVCGSVQESSVVFHAADPDFTLDPDSSIYCQGQTVFLDLGFAQPIFVDSITINYSSIEGAGGIVLDEIPLNDVPFNFNSDSDTLVVNFVVTAFNSCASVSKTLTAFILPTDVSADFDIPFSPPVCIGDSIPIVFNSTGNVDATLRQIETDDPNVEVLQILGNWYLIPQEGTADGELTINLTEFGFCGIDFDQEMITLGPTLEPEILSEDVCRGGLVTLVPLLEQDASLVWQITPDSTLNVDFPPPILYPQPGLYFPSVMASAEGYCDGSYTDTVEVFDPIRPFLRCDADCDGGQGCSVTFDAVSVCVGLQNPELFNSFEWYVRRSFFPAAGSEVEIAIDDLVPCEENLVRLVARDENNCRVEVAENIEFTDVLLYAPNAFTPNADSFNDVFRPAISGAPVDYSMRIFDRWGNLVFETNDPEEPWLGNVEGKEHYSDAEVYSYLIEYLPCQPEEEEKRIKRTGMITLIR